jgi:hypothetical protein
VPSTFYDLEIWAEHLFGAVLAQLDRHEVTVAEDAAVPAPLAEVQELLHLEDVIEVGVAFAPGPFAFGAFQAATS